MDDMITVEQGGLELEREVRPLWEALFDHHLAHGAAGLPTIPRERSWPLRLAHYRRIFAERGDPRVLVARRGTRPVGYALGYDEEHEGALAGVVETLSLLPEARGCGLGPRLMDAMDDEARRHGATTGIVDVVVGNVPAFRFYERVGFEPYSETWMRSASPLDVRGQRSADLTSLARDAGVEWSVEPGPDDTWITSERIATLAPRADRGDVPDADALRLLVAELEASGCWTVQITVPTGALRPPARERLASVGFTPALRRLTRSLASRVERPGAAPRRPG